MKSLRLLILSLVVGLSGCGARDGTSPLAYRNPTDMITTSFGMGDSCYRRVERNGVVEAEFIGMEKCYRFDPPRRFHGVWRDAFEGSAFYDSLDAMPAYTAPVAADFAWLDVEKVPAADLRMDCRRCSEVALIDFVGRKTSFRGRYGHMGMSPNYIIVDKIISMRRLPTPPDDSPPRPTNEPPPPER